MTDTTGYSGFLPTVTFTSPNASFTSAQRIAQLSAIGITGFYEADFADNITTIEAAAFVNDIKVVVVTINKVTSIGPNAFNECTNLRAITLDTAIDATSKKYLLTSIGANAFNSCTSLRNLHIPDTVKNIPDSMCYLCSNLEVAVMGYGCASRDANDNYIVDGTIGPSAFANCPKLQFFIIPETVASVGNSAFFNNPVLSYVAILGKPTFGTTVFGGTTMNSGARYVYDINMSDKTMIPASATKNEYYEYEFTASSGTTITNANVLSRFNGLTNPTPTWVKVKLKGTGTGYVQTINDAAFRPLEIGAANYSKIIGFSFPSSISSIRYGAFEAYAGDSNSGTVCNMAAHYIPNSVTTTSPNASFGSYTFNLAHPNNVQPSQTKQIVFQSGPNKIQLGQYAFRWNSARAIIINDIASTNAADQLNGIPAFCFLGCFDLRFCNFFQKNAYSTFNLFNNNAFDSTFTNSGPHYIYIPKQIRGSGFTSVFPGTTSNFVFTVYDKYFDGTAGNGIEGLGSNTAGDNTYLKTAHFGVAAAYATFHLICNWHDAAGLLSGTSNQSEYNYHLLFPSTMRTITNRFSNSTKLKTVTIPDTVTNFNVSAFLSCTGLTNVYISPTSNLTIIGESAINNCTSLTSFFIPNSVKRIEINAFNASTGLATVTYGDNPGLTYIGPQAFYNTTKALTSIFIPSSVVFIGYRAFICGVDNVNVNILNTVTFGAGSRLRYIGGGCLGFAGGTIAAATYLRDLVLPNTIRVIGTNSVVDNTTCQALRTAFTRAHSANLVFPSSLEYISESILYSPTGSLDISNIYLPLSITNVAGPRKHCGYTTNGIGNYMFGPSASKTGSLIYLPSHLSGFTVGAGTTAFPDANRGRSYYKTMSFTTNPLLTLILSSGNPTSTTSDTGTSQIHADIKDGVTVIGGGTLNITNDAGNGSLNLISVNIPSTVTTISPNAFNGCGALVYVTFSENSKLTTIGNSAFLGCTTIHDIQLPDTVTTIGANAFSGCTNLASISIPYNVTSSGLGARAFARSTVVTKLGQDIVGENPSDQSGYSVAMNSDGTIVAIGAITNISNTTAKGHVRVWKYNGSAWTILGAEIDGEATNDQFGWSVSLSSDGTIVAIGANQTAGVNGATSGRVRVYKFNGSAWAQLGGNIDGEATTDQSGYSVSLSADGTIVAIGAINNDGTTGLSTDNRGHVRIYKYDSAKTTSVTDQASFDFGPINWRRLGTDIDGKVAGDQSGFSVSLSSDGTIVAIGAITNDGNGNDSGHVMVRQYNGTAWTQLGSDIGGEAAGDDSGYSVSLSKDGKILAIGARDNNSSRGQVRVYNYQTITDATWTNYTVNSFTYANKPIVANGGDANPVSGKYYWVQLGGDIEGEAASDWSGWSVSLNADGNIVAIGAPYNDGSADRAGHVRIYQYESAKTTNITDQASIDFGPIGWRRLFGDIDGQAAIDFSGYSVSLSKDGNTVAIGANGNSSQRGHVRVYQLSKPCAVRLHQRLYNDISGSLTTYFPGISTSSFQVVPALTLTNTLNPSKLTISQINNMYIRYRQSQLGCTYITVSASSGGTLSAADVTLALSGTAGLVHLDIGANVTSIATSACQNNLRIYSVAISKTVVTIGTDAFNSCPNLTYLSFHPDSVCTTIGYAAVHNTNIIDLALPDSLTTIGESAFQSSWRLASACIPKNVTSMGIQPFHNCPKLTAVAVPARLNAANGTYFSISTNAIYGTNGITFTSYSNISAIPHFKLSDYSMPNGIVQTVIDSAVKYIDHRAYAYYPDITLYAVTPNKQTQTPGPHSYTANNVLCPIMPATFWLNGGSSNNFISNSMFPIYRSVPDLNIFSLDATAANWLDDQGDHYILMPGYSICIYNNLYDEENLFTDGPTYRYYDNEFGIQPLNITINVNNTTSSILIMFNGRILSKYFAS
jgi:hypothetical protein